MWVENGRLVRDGDVLLDRMEVFCATVRAWRNKKMRMTEREREIDTETGGRWRE